MGFPRPERWAPHFLQEGKGRYGIPKDALETQISGQQKCSQRPSRYDPTRTVMTGSRRRSRASR